MSRTEQALFRVLISVVLVLAAGCTATLRNEQLETVAKDWSLVIRASQVIPVYPLTEDLQPGDVLLVSTPLDQQAEAYKKKGFLPLDQHLVRLPIGNEFKEFYSARYGIDDGKVPPSRWQEVGAEGKHNWRMAPHVAFPTYRFSSESGSGLNLAIPIQGVPFALGFMNAGKASGTVTMSDAYTFGLDNARLEQIVRNWAYSKRSLLRSYGPAGEHHHFLRVVSRVYVTGRVSVTVTNDDASSAGAAAGIAPAIAMPTITDAASADNYRKAIDALSDTAGKQLGATVKIASATSRSVTFSEEFEKPLVIGYVGFDMPILEGGRIGAPISTLARLTDDRMVASQSTEVNQSYLGATLSHMYAALSQFKGSDEADRALAALDRLDVIVPQSYPFSRYSFVPPENLRRDTLVVSGSRVSGAGFTKIVDYVGLANATIEAIERIPSWKMEASLKSELAAARAARDEVLGRLQKEPAMVQAIDLIFFGR